MEEEKSNQRGNTVGLVPRRALGRTGMQVSALALGGYHLGSAKNQQEVNDIVARAMEAGVNFFDNAWDYHSGHSESVLGTALKGKRQQVIVMSKVCTHGRGKDLALQQLEESLRRLQTDYLDLWQIHEVIYENDPDLIFRSDGVAEALVKAKQQGKVRAVGFTGHKDPKIHLRMLNFDFPFDTVQMPLNCLDATFRSFEVNVLPVAEQRGLGVLGMKSMGGSGEIVTHGAATPEQALRYAMSLPVSSTISGVDSIQVLDQNLEVAREFRAMPPGEMEALRKRCSRFASDGRYELFKVTKKYDGDVGREQHGFPLAEELPA
ncbi:MAG TPA: aldo/keto reductase [Candidatus Limnocylindrales bacterium]|nr:aldo/keto reductase [Candidatus Limnocylindrales bacterium]HZM09355.1 aldo/keto reductase [Candidatus Limnocylindrales bacterium]